MCLSLVFLLSRLLIIIQIIVVKLLQLIIIYKLYWHLCYKLAQDEHNTIQFTVFLTLKFYYKTDIKNIYSYFGIFLSGIK